MMPFKKKGFNLKWVGSLSILYSYTCNRAYAPIQKMYASIVFKGLTHLVVVFDGLPLASRWLPQAYPVKTCNILQLQQGYQDDVSSDQNPADDFYNVKPGLIVGARRSRRSRRFSIDLATPKISYMKRFWVMKSGSYCSVRRFCASGGLIGKMETS